MAQGSVGVEAGGVDGVVNDMNDAITALRNSVREIDDSAQAVVRGWKGDAHDEFTKVAGEWHDEANSLNKKLDELSNAVNSGKSTLVGMDSAGLGGGGGGGGSHTNL